MAYRINHIHLKAPDPKRTAEWYVTAFGFKIMNDEVRVFGDRFIRCASADGGINVNISGARTGETLGPGDANPHHGLEHFGFDSTDIDADIRRLERPRDARRAAARGPHRHAQRRPHRLSPRTGRHPARAGADAAEVRRPLLDTRG